MNFLLKQLKKLDRHFHPGGKLEGLYPLWEAQSTFLFTPAIHTGNKGPHVKDSMDLKRLMIMVVFALVPVTLFGIYNAGYQTAKAMGMLSSLDHWQIFANGAAMVMPIIIVSYATGGVWEVLFALIRKHSISEGFLVTGLLVPLILPPSIPLWEVALGVSFGVVFGKEIFGGTGMNVFNPALTARIFLFFTFPVDMSGDKVWVNLNPAWIPFNGGKLVDGFTGATPLLAAANNLGDAIKALGTVSFHDYSLMNLFIGLKPGSIGETSILAILIGAFILIVTGVGSWKIMLSVIAGGVGMATFLNLFASDSLPAIVGLPPLYHLLVGGFLFGTVFMATDPVSSAATETGKYIYGAMIGVLTVLVRVWNPAYPEGMMLSIIFMNIFAPLIDYFVLQGNINKRLKRAKKR